MIDIASKLMAVVLFNSIISFIGQAAITNFVYEVVFTYVAPSAQHKQVSTLKRDIVKGRMDLHNTSAQDEFAKWAKIRRKIDKQVADLETLNASLSSHKSHFTTLSKMLIFVGTTGLQWFFTTRYSRDAIVYLPKDWFGPLTWFLGLPFAPAGALSCGVFIMLVRRVIGILTRVGTDIVEGVRGDKLPAQPIAVPAESSQPPISMAKKRE